MGQKFVCSFEIYMHLIIPVLNIKTIFDACFQSFPKQPLDLAQEYVLGSSKILLEHFCEYEKLLKQDSCLSQALLLGPSIFA